MNLLFWNISKRPVARYVVQCATEWDADIVCIAEHENVDSDELCKELGAGYRWINSAGGCDVVRMFAKSTVSDIRVLEKDRYIVSTLTCGGSRYAFATTHLPDRRNNPKPDKRCRLIRRMVADIRDYEEKEGVVGSIVMGDFNANPFDPELVSLDTLNATLFLEVVKRLPQREEGGEVFPVWYNPVLRALNEESMSYGSFYMPDGVPPIYWHCLDQVVVSSSLAERVSNITYVRTIGGQNLMAEARPRKSISDHLPLVVAIDGRRGG